MKQFVNKETDVSFVYDWSYDGETVLAPPPHGGRNMVYNQRVFVDDAGLGQGWRHAVVLSSVAYVIVDEMEADGQTWWVTEKWPIRHI